jgi:hypothetical protein
MFSRRKRQLYHRLLTGTHPLSPLPLHPPPPATEKATVPSPPHLNPPPQPPFPSSAPARDRKGHRTIASSPEPTPSVPFLFIRVPPAMSPGTYSWHSLLMALSSPDAVGGKEVCRRRLCSSRTSSSSSQGGKGKVASLLHTSYSPNVVTDFFEQLVTGVPPFH